MRIVDAHTHLFPPEVVDDRRAFLERDSWFGELHTSPKAKIVGADLMIASMDDAGVATSVVCGWPWRDPGLCRFHNDFLAEVGRQHQGRIAWLAIVNPADSGAPAEIERCIELGAIGVGELNADAQGFTWEHPSRLGNAVEASIALGVPWLIHCSEPIGHPYPGKGTATPDKLVTFFASAPELSIVAAHWGGGLPFYELMPEVAAVTRNVVYDSAATTYLYRPDVFAIAAQLVGAGRVAWATDYPLLRQAPLVRKLQAMGFEREHLALLMGGTADRVFRLDEKGFQQ